MHENLRENGGMSLLVKKYKKIFRIPENQNFYSEEDYKKAEKKFLKFVLSEGAYNNG